METWNDTMSDRAIPETIRVKDGYIEIFGGATGLAEDALYYWSIKRLESGQELASYLRQIAQKSWAHPALMKHLIETIADWFDGETERRMEEQMREAAKDMPAPAASVPPT